MAETQIDIEGDLTLAQPSACDEWVEKITANDTITLDFAKVGRIDSTAVALLVRLTRRATVNNSKVLLTNIPEQLEELLGFYDLKELFEQYRKPSP